LSRRNEAKLEILSYIYEVEFATGKEIADYRDLTHGGQSTLLKRYWNYGLLNRCSGVGKEKVYSLSDRGLSRLIWLEEQFSEDYSEENENDSDDDQDFLDLVKSLKRCKVKNTRESWDFIKDLKRCKVVRAGKDYIEIESDPSLAE